jgi:hypothetical protein
MIRHFTQWAERADGLARGARLPLDSLLRLQDLDAEGKSDSAALCAADLDDAPGASLARTLAGSPWLVRRSRPAVGFASLEITAPWQVSASAGVNEAGLAVCIVPGRANPAPPFIEPASPGRVAASIGLLVQECLQRFEDVDAGIGWCLDRPAAGEGTILLGDAAGQRGAIRFGRDGRSLEREPSGPLLAGSTESVLEGLRARALAGSVAEGESLSAALASAGGSALVRLSCGGRQLEIREGAAAERVLSLRADEATEAAGLGPGECEDGARKNGG